MRDRLIERIAAGGRSVARSDVNGTGVPSMHGSDQTHGLVPVRADPLEVDAGTADLAHAVGDRAAHWQEQMPVLQRLQPRAQIEAEELGQGHREVRVAVGIDGELCDLEGLVADDALDGGTGLALLVEYERLGVEDAPAIAHVRVDADRGRLAARIEAGLPDALGGLEAHQVGGREVGAAPGGGDRMAMHEREHGAAGRGESALLGGPAHRLADGRGGELRDHARGLGRRECGAVAEDAA